MSCYEWESGSFKLSVVEYSKLKKSFMSGVKALYTSAYDDAIKLYNKILAEGKGKRLKGTDWFNFYQKFRTVIDTTSYFHVTKELDPFDLAMDSMFRKVDENGRRIFGKPLKPRRGDFAIKIKNVFQFEEASINFSDKERKVYWDVSENNHACDRAAEHPIGKLFFKCLGKVNWTRGTGGVIVGNDEYRQDDREAGGGSNYIKQTYGPIGKEKNRLAFSF